MQPGAAVQGVSATGERQFAFSNSSLMQSVPVVPIWGEWQDTRIKRSIGYPALPARRLRKSREDTS
jgi:hypothetical protein